MNILNTILDLIFPTKCISCGKNSYYLCKSCLSNSREAERQCPEWVFPIYDYRDILIKKSLWLLKYNGKRRLAELFAQSVYPRIIEELSDLAPLENFTKPILIPIPLSNKRFRERGFNQSELICKYLMKIDRENNQCNFELIDNVLIKPKETIHQAKIENRNERLKNLKGTFTVKNQELIKKRNIILIDDITTTGATLNEAKKILKENGANKIIAFTIAH